MIGRGYFSTLVKALKAISFSAAVAFQAALYWSCSRQAPEERSAVHSNAESEGVVGPVFQRWNEEDFGGVLSVGLEGHRSFSKGEEAFVLLGCKECHRFVADNLSLNGASEGVPLRHMIYSPEELLGHILRSKSHSKNRQGLLNDLEQDGVLDLLAYILSGADGAAPFFIGAR